MARRSSIRNASRLRRTLQRIGKENGEIVRPLLDELEDSAIDLQHQIEFNIQGRGLVDEGDLLDSVARVKQSGGFVWKVGFFRKGAVRKWRRAGWRAHFAEFGTRRQPATPIIAPAVVEIFPEAVANIKREVDRALERFANGRR